MTTNQYLAALRKLGLSVGGQATGEALGLSARQLTRYANGAEVTPMLARLLEMYLKHGIPTH